MGSFFKAYPRAFSNLDFNLRINGNTVNEFQDEETSLDYTFSTILDPVSSSIAISKENENNPAGEKETTGAILKLINQALLDDDLGNRPYTMENSTLKAAEKSLYHVLCSDINKKQNTVCSCTHSSNNDLFDIVRDLRKYKSSICSCHTALNQKETFKGNMVVNQQDRLVRVRSLDLGESEFRQGRNNKYIALCAETEETILVEMFNNMLFLYGAEKETTVLYNPSPKPRGTKKGLCQREAAEVRSLLTQCMTSIAGCNNHDTSNANILLKQIRSCANLSGDGTQMLAHFFADALDARLAGGEGLPQHKNHNLKTLDTEVWKGFKLYLTAFPFMQTSYFYANQMIMNLAEKREPSTIHVIHYGIMHGLQWPPFIESLSKRPGRPIKLRITGIDFPRSGFRPDELVERTKRRLAGICERFNIPFEYKGFVKNWESVTAEDIRIGKDELVVVNCLYHFMYLPDDTLVEHSRRDVVLRMIKRLNPDLFVHAIVNGTYNSPFFMSRFREALFHFTTLFQMFDVVLSREDPQRMVFEREIWGREITNIIACEGIDRVERPETYKEWGIRMVRAGFKQLPLNEKIVKQVRSRFKSYYHKDFFIDEAGYWLLDGWKGRPLFGLSSWEPLDNDPEKETKNTKN